jgi:hypothetical protein
MKLKSSKYKSRSIRFFNEKVEFDSKGEAKVSDKLGKKINDEYADHLNPPKLEVKTKELPEGDKECKKVIGALESEKKILGEKVEELEGKLELALGDVDNWKGEYQKVIDERGDPSNKISEQDIKLVLELEKSNMDKLREMAVELKYPEEEWKELKKEELVTYLSIKALNANT